MRTEVGGRHYVLVPCVLQAGDADGGAMVVLNAPVASGASYFVKPVAGACVCVGACV